MIRRVDRYLWREVLWPFVVALLAFLVFIGLQLVLSLSDILFARGAEAGQMLRLLGYKLPYLFTLAIPAGVLLAIMLALGRLTSDQELLAFQAAGFSLRRLLLPFVAFGAAATLVSLALGEFAVPKAEAAYRRELLSLLYQKEVPTLQEDIFFRGSEGELYYIQRYDGVKALGVVVYDLAGRIFPREGPFPVLLTANEGRFTDQHLELFTGRMFRFSGDGGLSEVMRFSELVLTVGEEVQRGILGGETPSEMSLRELSARIALFRRSGLDPRNLVVEYHSKLAVAAASLVFALFGAPLGALLGRRGRATGAIAGFLLAALAQGLFMWTRTLARRGIIPAPFGGWLPPIAFGILGLWLFLRVDRLRLRKSLFLLLMVGFVAQGAPPFEKLTAEELYLPFGAQLIQGKNVSCLFRDYELSAMDFVAQSTEAGWDVEATDALLVGNGVELQANRLAATFDADGTLQRLWAQDFSGSSQFSGPEKEEILIFIGERGEAEFSQGELVRLEARKVQFTTCPCFAGAPYHVSASRFILLPKCWLYAENVRIESFGIPAGWLPVYVARLGEEASPFFPEFGQLGGELFFRWNIPWALREGAWVALGLAWFPISGRIDPSLRVAWDGGSGNFSRQRGEIQARYEPWRASLSFSEEHLAAELDGKFGDWGLSIAWGRLEESAYERAPEIFLRHKGITWFGGSLSLQLSGGRFQEKDTLNSRTSVDLSWTKNWKAGPIRIETPFQFQLDQYSLEERVFLAFRPRLALAGLSITYQGRVTYGRSPFDFDAAPSQSQIGISFSGQRKDLIQRLSLGWDLQNGEALLAKWIASAQWLSVETAFLPAPLTLDRVAWSAGWRAQAATMSILGGFSFSTQSWEDILIKGSWLGENIFLRGGVRLGLTPFRPLRLVGEAEWRPTHDWTVRILCEYDSPTQRFLQLGGAIMRTFLGCLRIGVEADLSGFRLTIDVPAFPQAKVRFSPLDEGLRLGE